MRDDQRPGDQQHPDDEDERFDDALDDLFGPDDDEEVTRPRPSRQQPQPPGGTTPPSYDYSPDPGHRHDVDEPLSGPDEAADEAASRTSHSQALPGSGTPPPPPSYDRSSTTSQPTATQTTIPVSRRPAGRNWRRIACFGCLAAVGIPALCLLILLIIGLIVDTPDSDPTQVGVFIDDGTVENVTETSILETPPSDSSGSQDSSGSSDLEEPFRSIMDGRQPIEIEVEGESGFGALDKPIPLAVRAPLGDGWDLQVQSVTRNANQMIEDANMFNDPPAEDRQFIIATVAVTNTGAGERTFDASFRLRLVSTTSGNTYTTFDEFDRCGVVPDATTDDPVPTGQANTGNVCWQVRIDDLDSLVVYSEDFSESEAAIWFALTGDDIIASE